MKFFTRVGAGCLSVVNDFVLVNDAKRMNFCQDISSWEREIDFDPGSMCEVEKECWVNLHGETAKPPTHVISAEDVSDGNVFWFSNLTFKDPNTFIAGRLHTCIEEWEKLDTPDFVFKMAETGVWYCFCV